MIMFIEPLNYSYSVRLNIFVLRINKRIRVNTSIFEKNQAFVLILKTFSDIL